MYKYSFRVVWSAEDSAYVATCPELPGVSALGESVEDALREAKVAAELYIEDVIESGGALPEPQTVQAYSGQFRVRLSKHHHRQAALAAADENISLNQWVATAVASKLGERQQNNNLICEIKGMLQEVEQRLARHSAQHSSRLAASID
jgi:predicted RNase H-like HicB family nuclease